MEQKNRHYNQQSGSKCNKNPHREQKNCHNQQYLDKGSDLFARIGKFALNAVDYVIWQERNPRIFSN